MIKTEGDKVDSHNEINCNSIKDNINIENSRMNPVAIVIFFIWFFGTTAFMIYAGKNEADNLVIYAIWQLLIISGILELVGIKHSVEEYKNHKRLYISVMLSVITVVIGIISMVLGVKYNINDETFVYYFEKILCTIHLI